MKKTYCGLVFVIFPVNFVMLGYGVWIFMTYFSDITRNMLVFGLLLVLQIFQFISYFIICLMVICTCQWHIDEFNPSEANQPLIDTGLQGIELEEVITNKPKKFNSEEEETCSICLLKLTTHQDLTELKHCKHIFHQNCIKQWLKIEPKCPNCNTSLLPHIP
ncbi:unnamed protein product [Moneuplotes crassus]|uniref:RING-type domain-containing protein n=1 Tax=Euplotes crassus TaxID=5936 RepID=A0AAD1XXB7_EUPCR|nr:unnamed protein product [Moneuplotes crassus]